MRVTPQAYWCSLGPAPLCAWILAPPPPPPPVLQLLCCCSFSVRLVWPCLVPDLEIWLSSEVGSGVPDLILARS